MPMLHMESDQVRATADQLHYLVVELDDAARRLNGSLSQLESAWQGPAAGYFRAELDRTLNQVSALSGDGATLSRRLEAEVAEWEQAAASLAGSPTAPTHSPGYPPMPVVIPSPGLIGRRWPNFGPGFPGGFSGGGAGGGSGGAWGAEPKIMPDIDTENHLLYGRQAELFIRYREGQMTWDEAMQHLKEMERSTRPDYLEEKLTFFEVGKWQSERSAAWQENTITGQYGSIDAAVGKALAQGQASLRYGEDGLESNLSGTAGIHAIHGAGNSQIIGVDLAGQAYLGAEVEGKFESKMNTVTGTVALGAGVNAFVGAKAEGTATRKDLMVDGLDVGGKGALMAGVGIVAEGELGLDGGVFKADFDLGAAWGIGAQVGFTIELNPYEAGQDIVQTGWDAISWAF